MEKVRQMAGIHIMFRCFWLNGWSVFKSQHSVHALVGVWIQSSTGTAGVGRERQSRHFPKVKYYKVCGNTRGTLLGKSFLDLRVPQRVAWVKHGWPTSGRNSEIFFSWSSMPWFLLLFGSTESFCRDACKETEQAVRSKVERSHSMVRGK